MTLDDFNKNFQWELDRLINEINAYQNEKNLWKTAKAIKNSGGNLALHLIGNLNHFIGNVMMQNGYERNRANEFNGPTITKLELVEQIENLKDLFDIFFKTFNHKKLQQPFPQQVFGFEMTNEFMLQRLLSHFSYHLGQISYHRRFLDE